MKFFNKNQFQSHQNRFLCYESRLWLVRVLAWRGDATTTSRRVAYVCAVGAHARAARADAPVLALVSTQRCARLRVSARWHACIPTCSHTDARLAKRGCSQQTGCALSEYEGLVRNRYRFLTPKMGSSFFQENPFRFHSKSNSVALISAVTYFS